MPGAPFLEAVAGILDRRQDGVHPVVVDLFVLRVAERSVSECQQVQQFGAERILHQGIVHRRDQFLEAFVRRILEIDRLGDQHGFVHVRIGIQRLVGVLIGISVVEVVVVLLGHRVVARLIPQHQVRVVVGGFGIQRLPDNILFDRYFGRCHQRQKQQQDKQFSHSLLCAAVQCANTVRNPFRAALLYKRAINSNRIWRSVL